MLLDTTFLLKSCDELLCDGKKSHLYHVTVVFQVTVNDCSYSGIHQYPLGIPADGYTQGCFVFFLHIDLDLLCGYGFSAGSGLGLTRHTRGFTHATA